MYQNDLKDWRHLQLCMEMICETFLFFVYQNLTAKYDFALGIWNNGLSSTVFWIYWLWLLNFSKITGFGYRFPKWPSPIPGVSETTCSGSRVSWNYRLWLLSLPPTAREPRGALANWLWLKEYLKLKGLLKVLVPALGFSEITISGFRGFWNNQLQL